MAKGAYEQIIEKIFFDNFATGDHEVPFGREDIANAASALGLERPRNLGDVVYSFRYRRSLPQSIREAAPPDAPFWVIRSRGAAAYRFCAVDWNTIVPASNRTVTKLPDSTPGFIEKYALTDEQALLAKLRYNRLLDIFLSLTCYSLQSHLRTQVDGVQIETDELYIGVDHRGAHYAIPVQAKGGSDLLGIVQIEQDFALCNARFESLIPVPVAAQFLAESKIALFQFEQDTEGNITIARESHFQLVKPDELSEQEVRAYASRRDGTMDYQR